MSDLRHGTALPVLAPGDVALLVGRLVLLSTDRGSCVVCDAPVGPFGFGAIGHREGCELVLVVDQVVA